MKLSAAAGSLLVLSTLTIAFTVSDPASPADASADAVPVADAQRIRLVPAPEGNEARYRVREQLANVEFPGDAVGRTSAITGALVIEPDGTIVKDESKFVIDLTTLESDAAMRDRYVRRNTLQTEQYPQAQFVPTAFRGLPSPLPTSGEVSLQVTGDLTVRNVTRPVTWDVTLRAASNVYSGTASTTFAFTEFEMTKPRVARVLSVNDSIRLEYDFRLVPERAGSATGGSGRTRAPR
jgi:polyisoprenoid-binding protein YceI